MEAYFDDSLDEEVDIPVNCAVCPEVCSKQGMIKKLKQDKSGNYAEADIVTQQLQGEDRQKRLTVLFSRIDLVNRAIAAQRNGLKSLVMNCKDGALRTRAVARGKEYKIVICDSDDALLVGSEVHTSAHVYVEKN